MSGQDESAVRVFAGLDDLARAKGEVGTGGSTGADYLRSTLFHPAFPELWEVRSVL